MKWILIVSIVPGVLIGCSKPGGGLVLSGTNGSGDLVPLVMQCAINRGGHAVTNVLPVIQASWTHQSREVQDIMLVTGDHFAEVQQVLEQAYGAPDAKLGSSAVAPVGGARALTYGPRQCGVVLNLTANSSQTIVTVMGRQKQ